MHPRLLLSPSRRRTLTLLARRRAYSTAPPCIKVTSVPAPHSGSIKILSLNREKARNAISRQLLAELKQEVSSIHAEGDNGSTRALIVASEVDSSFCAGADLKERATFTQDEYAIRGLVSSYIHKCLARHGKRKPLTDDIAPRNSLNPSAQHSRRYPTSPYPP